MAGDLLKQSALVLVVGPRRPSPCTQAERAAIARAVCLFAEAPQGFHESTLNPRNADDWFRRSPRRVCIRIKRCQIEMTAARAPNARSSSNSRRTLAPQGEAASCQQRTHAPQQMRRTVSKIYSMTSSARSRMPVGSSMPIALAVLRLTTSSNFVACSTGRSAGFVPLSILAT
jgi:hypothetical protein